MADYRPWPHDTFQDLRRDRFVLPPNHMDSVNALTRELLSMIPVLRNPRPPGDYDPYPGWRQSKNIEIRPGGGNPESPENMIAAAMAMNAMNRTLQRPDKAVNLDAKPSKLAVQAGINSIPNPGGFLRTWNIPILDKPDTWGEQPMIRTPAKPFREIIENQRANQTFPPPKLSDEAAFEQMMEMARTAPKVEPPALNSTDFPGLEEFLSPGQPEGSE
jgi:hypothetical protein